MRCRLCTSTRRANAMVKPSERRRRGRPQYHVGKRNFPEKNPEALKDFKGRPAAESLDSLGPPLKTPGGQSPRGNAAARQEDQHECYQCLRPQLCGSDFDSSRGDAAFSAIQPRSKGNEHHHSMVTLSTEGVREASKAAKSVRVAVAHKGLHGNSGHADKSHLQA